MGVCDITGAPQGETKMTRHGRDRDPAPFAPDRWHMQRKRRFAGHARNGSGAQTFEGFKRLRTIA
jgi:hypothetical protein